MKPRPPDASPADGAPVPGDPACPECGARLMRVRRRATDRLLSLVVPVQRYRCSGFGCQWEGTLRNRRCAAAITNAAPPEPQPEPQPDSRPARGPGATDLKRWKK